MSYFSGDAAISLSMIVGRAFSPFYRFGNEKRSGFIEAASSH
jgi:hypothetical protein